MTRIPASRPQPSSGSARPAAKVSAGPAPTSCPDACLPTTYTEAPWASSATTKRMSEPMTPTIMPATDTTVESVPGSAAVTTAATSMPGTTVASWMISSGCQLRLSTPMTFDHQSEKDVATSGSVAA